MDDPPGAPGAADPAPASPGAAAEVARLLARADDLRKAAPARSDAEVVRPQLAAVLEQARDRLPAIDDDALRLELAGAIARRVADLDRDELVSMLGPSPAVAPAPTQVDDPGRIPPGQHLTAGFPVLHVGRAPTADPATWRFTVTGLVGSRTVLDLTQLQAMPRTEVVRDFHCVTGWSRLDNRWTGVAVRDLLRLAEPRPGATHAIVSGHPAYSASLDLDVLTADDVLLSWAHDGAPLATEHGGPLRLVVPSRYGWKSVKWAFELRLVDRDVRGYWEERGYHDVGDPWLDQRFRGD